MNTYREERLPQVVEDRLQEAYDIIRKEERKKMNKKKLSSSAAQTRTAGGISHTMAKQPKTYRRWIGAAAAVVLAAAIPSGVYAAVSYFQRNVQEEADSLTYAFDLNYDLIPGEYQVKAGYLPEGMSDDGSGQYRSQTDNRWITVMPVYTMAELDSINGQIVVEHIDQVEHTQIGGMAADVITFKEADKYRSATWLFLFNEHAGYVLDIRADYSVPREELLKFAEALQIERTGDGSFETVEDKELREKEAAAAAAAQTDAAGRWDDLMRQGIPAEKIHPLGEELRLYDGSFGYRITDYAFLNSIAGFDKEGFFDYTRFDGWLNPDQTLRPYTRQHYDKNLQLLSEERTNQEILRVDVEVTCYDDEAAAFEAPLNLDLTYVKKKPDGSLTWAEDSYEAVPAEEYYLQMDHSAVYIDSAVHTEGEERKSFFYQQVNKGETLRYTLLFVVDQDRKDDFLLSPMGYNNSLWQSESMTVPEIQDSLDGYLRLQ